MIYNKGEGVHILNFYVITNCLLDISAWISIRFIKFNISKTELLVLLSSKNLLFLNLLHVNKWQSCFQLFKRKTLETSLAPLFLTSHIIQSIQQIQLAQPLVYLVSNHFIPPPLIRLSSLAGPSHCHFPLEYLHYLPNLSPCFHPCSLYSILHPPWFLLMKLWSQHNAKHSSTFYVIQSKICRPY